MNFLEEASPPESLKAEYSDKEVRKKKIGEGLISPSRNLGTFILGFQIYLMMSIKIILIIKVNNLRCWVEVEEVGEKTQICKLQSFIPV